MQHKRPFILITIIVLTLTTAWQIGLLGTGPAWAAAGDGNADKEQGRLGETEALLGRSTIGVTALGLMKQYDVKVAFAQGGGTYYRTQANTVVIDLSHEPLAAALLLVHEMNHARVRHRESLADIQAVSREDYVLMKLQEEAESVALSLQFKMELAHTGLDVSAVSIPLEREYEAALRALKSNVPGMGDDDLHLYGERAGRKLVFDALMSGKVRGSNSDMPYPEKFGLRWDEAHEGSS